MAEDYVASRSRDEARERIRLITEELARRSRTEHLKAEADAMRVRLTAQAKAKVNEKREELTARAKEAARDKAQTIKEQVMAKPVALAIAGGVAGAVVGAILGRRAEQSQHYVSAGSISTTTVEPSAWETRRGYAVEGGAPYYGESAGAEGGGRAAEMKERVSGAVDQAKEKAAGAVEQAKERAGELKERALEMKERVSERAGEVREKLSERASMGEMRGRASGFLREDPMILAFGALAFGATMGLLMPLSDTERRALHGAHVKAREGLRTGIEKAQEVVSERAAEVVPSLLGVKKAEKHEEREVQTAQGSEELEVERRGNEGLEPPAIH